MFLGPHLGHLLRVRWRTMAKRDNRQIAGSVALGDDDCCVSERLVYIRQNRTRKAPVKVQ